jgi:hypothetical protein
LPCISRAIDTTLAILSVLQINGKIRTKQFTLTAARASQGIGCHSFFPAIHNQHPFGAHGGAYAAPLAKRLVYINRRYGFKFFRFHYYHPAITAYNQQLSNLHARQKTITPQGLLPENRDIGRFFYISHEPPA